MLNEDGSRKLFAVGEETPMPGREKEVEAYKAQYGSDADAMNVGGPAAKPPPIDEERRNRSPGLQNNFYETSTADFKRPWGFGGRAAPPEPAPEPKQEPPAARERTPTAASATDAPAKAVTPATSDGALEAKLARLERCNVQLTERLEATLEEIKLREEAAAREIEEAREREEILQESFSRELDQLDEKLEEAIAEMRARGDATTREAEESKAREEALLQSLSEVEKRLEARSTATGASSGDDDWMAAAISELITREEVACKEAADAQRREELLVQRLADVEKRLGAQASVGADAVSSEWVKASLAELRAREESACKEAAEARAREKALARRLSLLEERIAAGALPLGETRVDATRPAVRGPEQPTSVDVSPEVAIASSVPAGGAPPSGQKHWSEVDAESSRVTPPAARSGAEVRLRLKVARIRERLGLAPAGGSLVAAVRGASAVAGMSFESTDSLENQVDLLMKKLFGGEA